MKNAELEKENARYKSELKAAKDRTGELEADVEVLTKAVRCGKEKLRLELFLKFGSASEKYRKLFNIPVGLLERDEDELSDEEKKLLEAAKTAVKDSKKKISTRRNRHPEYRKPGTGGGRQTFDPSHPRQINEYALDQCLICGRPPSKLGSQDVNERELDDYSADQA